MTKCKSQVWESGGYGSRQRGLCIPGSGIETPSTYQWKPYSFEYSSIPCKTNHNSLKDPWWQGPWSAFQFSGPYWSWWEGTRGARDTDLRPLSCTTKLNTLYTASAETGNCFPQKACPLGIHTWSSSFCGSWWLVWVSCCWRLNVSSHRK